MPQRLLEALEALHDTRRQMDNQRRELEALRHAVDRSGWRREATLVGILAITGAILLHTLGTPPGPDIGGVSVTTWGVGLLGTAIAGAGWLRR